MESPIPIEIPKRCGLNEEENILSKIVEMGSMGPRIPAGICKVACMLYPGDLGIEGELLCLVMDDKQIPEEDFTCIGNGTPVAGDSLADEAEL